jgi:hypothetical protein
MAVLLSLACVGSDQSNVRLANGTGSLEPLTVSKCPVLRTCARFLAMKTILTILAAVLFTAAIISHHLRQPSLSFALLMASVICATY